MEVLKETMDLMGFHGSFERNYGDLMGFHVSFERNYGDLTMGI